MLPRTTIFRQWCACNFVATICGKPFTARCMSHHMQINPHSDCNELINYLYQYLQHNHVGSGCITQNPVPLSLPRSQHGGNGLPVRPQPAGSVLQDVCRVRRLHGLRQEVRQTPVRLSSCSLTAFKDRIKMINFNDRCGEIGPSQLHVVTEQTKEVNDLTGLHKGIHRRLNTVRLITRVNFENLCPDLFSACTNSAGISEVSSVICYNHKPVNEICNGSHQ